MDGIGNGYSNGVESMASFWKKNAKTVPGRPSPKKDAFLGRTSGSASFNEFQASVNDAWDMGDDEFCIISGNTDTKISKKVSQSAALTVINSHRGGNPLSTQSVLSVHQESKKTSIDSTECSDFKCDLSEQKRSTVERSPSTSERSFYPGRPQPMCCPVLPTQEGDCETKLERFVPLLKSDLLDLTELRHLSWSGIPIKIRAVTWRLLCGYLPVNMERRNAILERKRLDYWSLVKQYYDTERDETYQDTYRQIHIDIPRMNPTIALFQQITVQQMFERILFIWAIRHPASGYVQGINDLVTPFFVVFLQEVVPFDNLDNFNVASLSKEQQDIIEADSFWCLSKFLDSIQDNYIFAQLGIQQKVNQLKELIQRIDGPLHRHLTNHGVDYLQFSFRWMNNLLTRELPLHCTIRLWDTYLAESDGFPSFQLYVCAAFLLRWKPRLMQEKDFQGLLLKLQNLPTQGWTNSDINMLVAEAYRLKFMFADAPNHLLGTGANR